MTLISTEPDYARQLSEAAMQRRMRLWSVRKTAVRDVILIASQPEPPRDVIDVSSTPRQRAESIIHEECAIRGIDHRDVLNTTTRTRPVANARHACIWRIADTMRGWSSVAIGRFFGVDHSSVLYAIAKENRRRGTNIRGISYSGK